MRRLLPMHLFPEGVKLLGFLRRVAMRYLHLFECVDQLFDGLFQEFNILYLQSLIFLHPCFDWEQSGLVELLRFDNHFNPSFLLLLNVLNNILMIYQVFFIFGEILSTDVFKLRQLFIVFFIDVIVATIHVLCTRFDISFELINFFRLAWENFIF